MGEAMSFFGGGRAARRRQFDHLRLRIRVAASVENDPPKAAIPLALRLGRSLGEIECPCLGDDVAGKYPHGGGVVAFCRDGYALALPQHSAFQFARKGPTIRRAIRARNRDAGAKRQRDQHSQHWFSLRFAGGILP